jgi:hypothetical protein
LLHTQNHGQTILGGDGMKTFHIDGDDISDGYHTFAELYQHRVSLFVRLCRTMPDQCAWKRDKDTPGWIILYCELPENGQVSYHIPDLYISRLGFWGIKENPEYKWDGHDSSVVIYRLESI